MNTIYINVLLTYARRNIILAATGRSESQVLLVAVRLGRMPLAAVVEALNVSDPVREFWYPWWRQVRRRSPNVTSLWSAPKLVVPGVDQMIVGVVAAFIP